MANPLTAYRRKHKLSQGELAEKLGCSRQLVGLIEKNKRRITPDNANKWEGKIGVPRDVLCPIFAQVRRKSLASKPESKAATASAGR